MIETNRKIIKNKVGLLNLAEQLGNVSRACKPALGKQTEALFSMEAVMRDQGGFYRDKGVLSGDLRQPISGLFGVNCQNE